MSTNTARIVLFQLWRSARGPTARESLQVRRVERIAGPDGAFAETGRKPALALFGAAVGEGIRHHVAGRLALQRVVADRRRGPHRRLDVARLDERRPALVLLALVLVIRPYAGETVGLQLHLHLQPIGGGAI